MDAERSRANERAQAVERGRQRSKAKAKRGLGSMRGPIELDKDVDDYIPTQFPQMIV